MPLQPIEKCFIAIANKYDADILIFVSEVNFLTADEIISLIRKTEDKAKNCVLILTTWGGDPDAGYRIVKTLKRCYTKFTLFIFGACKSTGTLMALGADEIVMTEFGEFGPLDVQMVKDDELSHVSGLTLNQGLFYLSLNLFNSFEAYFLGLKQRSSNTITTRTAGDIACKLAIGLISPIASQIDPNKLGETQRAITIAAEYGKRLTDKQDLINRLMSDYPSHGFVIDIDESKEIFSNVKDAEKEENELEQLLFNRVRKENDDKLIQLYSKHILLHLEEKSKEEDSKLIKDEKVPVPSDTPGESEPPQD